MLKKIIHAIADAVEQNPGKALIQLRTVERILDNVKDYYHEDVVIGAFSEKEEESNAE